MTIRLAALLLLVAGVGCSNEEVSKVIEEENKIVYATDDIKEQIQLVAESEKLELYINTKTTEISIKNKKNGQMWYSNPQDLSNDALANGVNKSKLQSQIVISYSTPKGDVVEMNNYDYSISLGQFSLEGIESGIKVNYTLGKSVPEYNLPQVISEQNFQELILDQLDNPDEKRVIEKTYKKLKLDEIKEAKQKEEYLSRYPSLEQETIYILRDGQQAFRLQQFSDYLENIGYTKELARQEELDNGFNERKENITFNMSMTYQLESEGLVVAIDTDEIEYNPEYPIVDVKVLEYFGAANTSEDGYIFVPDASGALINFNNNKKQAQTYRSKVYGIDYAMQPKEKVEYTAQTYMPVFGMKYEEGAFIGIIEEGETAATIEADIAGKINQYNNVCTSFNVLPNEQIKLPSLAAMNIIKAYQQKFISGKLQIRYQFLEKEKANYTGMATAYREYLIETNQLTKQEITDTPFVVELLGAIEVDKNLAGIPYKGMEALTTYKEALSITQELLNNEVKNLAIKYTGMANGGISHTVPNKIKLEDCLGGEKEFKKLQSYANDQGVEIYPEFDIQYVHQNILFDNFKAVQDGARRIDKQMAKKVFFSYVTYQQDKNKEPIELVTFDYMNELTSDLIKAIQQKQIQGVSISNIGKDLSSDFNEKLNVDRQQGKEEVKKQLQKINEGNIKLMASGVNAYTLPYVDLITDLPLTSNHYNILDEEIPFMQIVLHGYIPYTGGAINLTQDYEQTLLKIIETGSGIQFTWIGGENYLLKDTDYSEYYSTSYKDWIGEAIAFYNRINEELGDTYNQTIIGHEEIQENVYQVEYEQGKKVIVNYNEYEVNVENQSIPGKDYSVIGGENE